MHQTPENPPPLHSGHLLGRLLALTFALFCLMLPPLLFPALLPLWRTVIFPFAVAACVLGFAVLMVRQLRQMDALTPPDKAPLLDLTPDDRRND